MNWFRSLWKKLADPSSVSGIDFADFTVDFTPRAKSVLGLAKKEATRFNYDFIGTEHLLLGLVKLRQGVAHDVLLKMGINLEILRGEVEHAIASGPEPQMSGNAPYTTCVMQVFRLAREEASALNHTYIGTEHILLGLLRERNNVPARLLNKYNVGIESLRWMIAQEPGSERRPGE
jgi:ATP-dependent Clp protease ATP-binding subunit ClpC